MRSGDVASMNQRRGRPAMSPGRANGLEPVLAAEGRQGRQALGEGASSVISFRWCYATGDVGPPVTASNIIGQRPARRAVIEPRLAALAVFLNFNACKHKTKVAGLYYWMLAGDSALLGTE
jgi:hypothetical protein